MFSKVNCAVGLLLVVIFSIALKSCSPREQKEAAAPEVHFTLLTPEETGIHFSNDIVESEEINALEWDAIYYGGGVAAGDINADGLTDLYFTGNQVGDRLYVNKGNFKFEDITEKSGIGAIGGWSTGVSMMDFNGDGNLDIYVCRSSHLADSNNPKLRCNLLYINNGNMTFTESAGIYGLDNEGYSTQMTYLDYDHDNDLDLFLLNAPSNNLKQKIAYQQTGFPEFAAHRLFRNDGDGKFTDDSKEAGVYAHAFGLGIIACDLDHDGWVDLYVANDYERPDFMYINQRNGTFKNMLNFKVKHTSFTSMGVDAGDINNDALVDFAVLDMQSDNHHRSKTNMPSMNAKVFNDLVDKGYNYQYMTNVLQLNHGTGFFTDIAQMAGVASTDWSWSALLADFDNDGFRDLHITNGINKDIRNNDFAQKFEQKVASGEPINLFSLSNEVPSTKLTNFLFANRGDLTFENKAEAWGLSQASFSYGTALADLDNDGDLDLIINNNNETPFIYRNNNPRNNNHLRIRIQGPVGNSRGEGTKAILFSGKGTQYAELTTVRGYQSASEPVIHFGLGSKTAIDSLLIIFPDGKVIKDKSVKANQTLTYLYAKATKLPFKVYKLESPIFQKAEGGLDFEHRENFFNEYADQILLPHMQGRTGPCIATSDFNADGLEGVYIGGAAGQSGTLFQQTEDGSFEPILSGLFAADVRYEDTCALFFDANGDGAPDLFIGSGGGHLKAEDSGYSDRLFMNDGNGNFTKVPKALPNNYLNTSSVASADLNDDGQLDLLVCSRGVPGRYPLGEGARVLMNTGGTFTDMTLEICPMCPALGMISSVQAADFDSDGKIDFALAGEWGAPQLLLNKEGKLYKDPNQSLDSMRGWWNHLSAVDLNADGRMDLVAGNFGLNTKFHPSQDKPFKVFAGDLDSNGTHDIVLSKKFKDRYVPLRGRQCSSEQVPPVAERFKDFNSFASASLEEVYGLALSAAYQADVTEFASGSFLNLASGWKWIPFPAIAQVSPVMSSICRDFNGDGVVDLLIAGNHFDAEVETTRHDSGNGLLLIGDGTGRFSPRMVLESGFYAPFNVKSLAAIDHPVSGLRVIVGNNNGPVSVFSLRP